MSIFKNTKGKNVIVRSRSEGINIGTIKKATVDGIILENCRRLWYHKPKDENQTWYEGVVNSGLSSDSKISSTVAEKVIIENYSIMPVDEKVFESIMKHEPSKDKT